MSDSKPLTIEVLGESSGSQPVVLDRVTGGTIYLDEAKRIGQRLFGITDADIRPRGFRILSHEQRVLFEWHAGDDEAKISAEGS
jgi:hypothetical protein